MGRGRRKSESLPKGEEVGTSHVKVEDGIGAFGLQEAPTFYPTEEEFLHPLQYIAQIRPQAETYGICRIVPPASWNPPFGLDTVKFTFPTKLQAIHHLQERPAACDADTFKLEYVRFLKKVGESVEGWPSLNDEELDLCKLFNAVKRYGGHAKVTLEDKWAEVVRMVMVGVSDAHMSSSTASMLREIYEKHLSVFEVYQMKVGAGKRWRAKVKQETTEKLPNKVRRAGKKRGSGDSFDLDLTGGSKRDEPADAELCEVLRPTPESETRFQSKRMGRRRKSGADADVSVVAAMLDSANDLSEVLRPSAEVEIRSQQHTPAQRKRRKIQDKFTIPDDLLGRTDQICEQCHSGAHEQLMLLCDRCDRGWHLYCLSPPLSAVPVGNWYCLECLGSDSESFGFGQGQEYSFDSFRRMADRFRRKWMGTRPTTYADIEREFWRVVEGRTAPVEVLYGSDLDTGHYGSGFPRLSDKAIPSWSTKEAWDEAARSPWNVNNFPKLDGSMLRLVHDNIPGVMVPWLYIGMLFSSFCWHYEDHCFYSVNYLHCGEPKSWYSVPGSAADDFEKVMKNAFPDLFEAQPDLLFQLVTMLKPTVLRDNRVPVYMTVQEARNFVITFPRSYHGGFNHGFNCAEAVNFAPSDWLPYGGFGVERYRLYHKAAVLSHDELLCVVAKNDTSCRKSPWLQQELARIITKERYQREYLWCHGMTKSSPMTPRPSSDHIGAEEDAECIICRYYLHLSAVVCRCRPGKAVCLQHARQLCECGTEQQTLMYRFTLAELVDLIGGEGILEDCKVGILAPAPGSNKSRLRRGHSGPSSRNNSMMKKVKGRQYRYSELADTWLYQASTTGRSHLRSPLLEDLISQAEQFLWGGHEMDQVREMVLKLNAAHMWVRDVVACSLAVERNGHTGSGKGSKVSFAMVEKLVNVTPTPWVEPHFQKLKVLYEPASKLELRIRDVLGGSSDVEIRVLQALQQEASSSVFEFPGLQQLKDLLESAQAWCDRARKVLSCTKTLRNRSRIDETNLEQLQALQAAGATIAVKSLEKELLEAAVSSAASWQKHATELLALSCTKQELEDALKRSESLVIHLAETDQLEERLRKLRSWGKRVRDALTQGRSNIDYEVSLRTFEDLVQEGQSIQVHDLEEMDELKSEAQKMSWRHRASKTSHDYPTISYLQDLVSEASRLQLSNEPLALNLTTTLKSASAWEVKTQHVLSSRGPLSLFQELSSSGKTVNAKLPDLVVVTESVAQAERLLKRAEPFLGPSLVVRDSTAEENNLSALRCLVADIQSCPVLLDEEQAVCNALSAVESWVSGASTLKASVSVCEQSENQIWCSLNRKADELDDTDERVIGPRPRKDTDTCRRLEVDLAKLDSAISEGLALNLSLPEINDLQSLCRATRWSLKAQDLFVGLPNLKDIEGHHDEAILLPRRPPEFSVLQRIVREAKVWLQHAAVFLSGRGAKGSCRESQIVKLISDAQLLSVSVVTEASCLKDILETHRVWRRNVQAVISGTASLPFTELLRLQETGSAAMIHYEGEGVLNTEIYEATAWMERSSAAINVQHLNRKLSLEDVLLEMRCSTEFALTFLISGGRSNQNFTCICRKPLILSEPQCDFCGDWFHQSCIGLRQYQIKGQKQNMCTYCFATSSGVLANNYVLFRKIHATQKPQLSLLRELLSAGQKFRCRIKEKEILDEVINLAERVEKLVQVVLEEGSVFGEKESTEVSRPLVAVQKALEVMEVQTGQKESLRTVVAVKFWRSSVLELLNDPSGPSLRSLTKMLKDGQAIPVCEEDAVMKQLKQVEARASQWVARAREVMGDGGCMPLAQVEALAAEGEQLPVNFVKELSALRERSVVYCVCREPYDKDRAMIACDQCGEWYHFSCINLPEPDSSDEETDVAGLKECVLAGEFVCPQCKELSTRREHEATAAIATDSSQSEQDSEKGALKQEVGGAQFSGLVRGKRSRRSSNRARGETLHKWQSPVYAPGKLLWHAQRKRKQHEQPDGSVSASGRPCRRTAGRHSGFESFVLLMRSR